MTTFRQQLHPHALIPWVFALVALFGCNLLAQQKASLRKSAQLDGGSVTLVADEDGASSTTTTTLTSLTGVSFDGLSLNGPPIQRIAVDLCRSRCVFPSHGGAVQGRAPPVTDHC